MRISPENIVIGEKFIIKNFFFYLTGNDETFMTRVEEELIKKFKKIGYSFKKRSEKIDMCEQEPSLFGASELFVVTSTTDITKEKIKALNNNNFALIVSSKNSNKDMGLKKSVGSSKDSILIECYDLDQSKKLKCIEYFLNKEKISLTKEAFWFLLEKSSNKYALLEKDLNKILLYGEKNLSLAQIKKIICSSKEESNEKLFFYIFSNTDKLIDLYRESINSLADFYSFFYSIKSILQIILNNKNENGAAKNFPKYLFKEKNTFLQIHKKIDEAKMIKILFLLQKTEVLVRENSGQFDSLGLRFLLNLRKVIVS